MTLHESIKSDLSNSEDEFITGKTHWLVVLSNGEHIYQDDDRPGISPPQAWIRLKNYVERAKLNVDNIFLKQMHVQFEVAPGKAPGYFFINKQIKDWGSKDEGLRLFVIGWFRADGMIIAKHWLVPQLQLVDVDIRNPADMIPSTIIRNSY